MKIRSITYFFHPGWPPEETKMRSASTFLSTAKQAFEQAGYEVQTLRLATTPFSYLLGRRIKEAPYLAEAMETLLGHFGVAYASLGPAFPDVPGSYEIIPEALSKSKNIFFSGVMADIENGISLAAVRACAEVIVQAANITLDGFANLRFAALANVPAGAPFFPAAYYQGERPSFALATQAADLALEAFQHAHTLHEGAEALVTAIETHSKNLASIARQLQFRFGAQFGGMDFSLAPFPEKNVSLGGAVERMGVEKVGLHGSLAAAAILTGAVERANFPRTGFNGFMQPVLEDSILASRAAEGSLTIKDLLLYSAVCGTGLDTVPLPGDVSADQLTPLLLDLSALALRLDKPLTARLMPIPGKRAGDPTNFDFDFFANSKVMALEAEPLSAVLAGDEIFRLQARG
ncbi:MAG: PFL family protein [Anaerolineales bacterium]